MARVRKKSAVPVYAVAFTWAFWASVLPMYKISHFPSRFPFFLSFLTFPPTQPAVWKDCFLPWKQLPTILGFIRLRKTPIW